MKSFDTIYVVRHQKAEKEKANLFGGLRKLLSTKISFSGQKSFPYFYKSLQIVLTFWIVTVLAITTQPWLDYGVKSLIKKNTTGEVMGEVTAKPDSDISLRDPSAETRFSLDNGKVKISAPIVEGIEKEDLKNGIGHHPDSVWPNQKGNVVLAGHNFDLDAENSYGKVFSSLRLVEIGDEASIDYQSIKYTYKVFRRETVSPNDKSLFSNLDDWILTFYTCDPPYTDWKRLVLQAKLVKIE